jgi:hypothetical protein
VVARATPPAAAPEPEAQGVPEDEEPEPTRSEIARTLPTGSSVARAATQSNVLTLRQINLIGVFGKPSNPKALVRLRNGRTERVGVGDRIDGGRVTAIGRGQLSYRKGNKDILLAMPRI